MGKGRDGLSGSDSNLNQVQLARGNSTDDRGSRGSCLGMQVHLFRTHACASWGCFGAVDGVSQI